MKCPACNGDTEVIESRGNSDVTIRRRHCKKCDRMFYTQEECIKYDEGSAKMTDIYNKRYKGVVRK